jgi:hypothetical protein
MRTILNYRRAFRATAGILLGLAASACARDAESNPGDVNSAAATAVQQGGKPAGSMLDWVAEMRTRVRAVPEMLGRDATAAQREVLDIYIGRQEFLEQYYGPAGTVSAGGPLGDEVILAERMFHDLMGLVGQGSGADVSKVRSLTDSLDKTLTAVARIAVEKGVLLTPPDSNSAPAASGHVLPASSTRSSRAHTSSVSRRRASDEFMVSRAIPQPLTTHRSGSSATETRIEMRSCRTVSRLRNSAPPPVIIRPWS